MAARVWAKTGGRGFSQVKRASFPTHVRSQYMRSLFSGSTGARNIPESAKRWLDKVNVQHENGDVEKGDRQGTIVFVPPSRSPLWITRAFPNSCPCDLQGSLPGARTYNSVIGLIRWLMPPPRCTSTMYSAVMTVPGVATCRSPEA